MDALLTRGLFLKDIKEPDELRVEDELAKEGDLTHCRVVYAVRDVLTKAIRRESRSYLKHVSFHRNNDPSGLMNTLVHLSIGPLA